MATIAVVPTNNSQSEKTYHAIAGNKQASGRTMGEAIDALTPLLEDDDSAATLVIVQQPRPDRFFTAAQQQRREELTRQWREAQDAGKEFPSERQTELESLVLSEVRAAGQRAAALLQGQAA